MENLNFITRNINEPYNLPRQKLPAIYFQSGDIEIIKRSTLFKGSISGKNVGECTGLSEPAISSGSNGSGRI